MLLDPYTVLFLCWWCCFAQDGGIAGRSAQSLPLLGTGSSLNCLVVETSKPAGEQVTFQYNVFKGILATPPIGFP